MVVGEASINNIMGGMESTGGVRLHNHKRKLKQRFDIIKKLGQGTYGKVQLGINKETGQEVAIKTIKKCKIETEADLIRIRREIQIMSSVQHPNIIHIYEVFENREKMVLVMEYAAGGELYDYLSERKVLPEEEARRIFRQISIAVFYCHKHKICHRDLKLENILLDQLGNAKIADFGLSNVFDDQRLLHTFCGSPLYASPEIVKGTPYHGPEVDCWSLGVLLYTLVYGAMPFDGSNFKRLTRQISASDYFEPKNPSPASPLIKDMLTKCPSRRADIERICSHWWVNQSYEQNCLDIAEELAAQTPVRLDLLLSLVPQSASADKLVVTNDQQQSETNTNMSAETLVPTRCHSVGSLMELDRNNADRMRDIVDDDDDEQQQSRGGATSDTKRKLETTPSMEETVAAGVKRKERSRRKERNDDREQKSYKSTSRHHSAPIANAITEEAMEVDPKMELDLRDPAAAAACLELIREAQSKSPSKERSRTPVAPEQCNADVTKDGETTLQNVNENIKDVKPIANKLDDVPVAMPSIDGTTNRISTECQSKNKSPKSKTKDVTQKDKILQSDTPMKDIETSQTKPEINNGLIAPTLESEKTDTKSEIKKIKQKAMSLDSDECPAVPPAKPTERRRSKIFETAEKFNQLAAGIEAEKPKKIFIPGVNVGGAKRVFERKASLSSVNVSPPIKPNASKVIIDVPTDKKNEKVEEKLPSPTKVEPTKLENERAREEEKKRAVDIITGALGKPPVQKKLNGSPPMTPQSQDTKKGLGLKIQIAPNDVRNATVCVTTPVDTKYPDYDASPAKPIAIGNSVPSSPESKSTKNSFNDEPTMSSKMEITLKSATLPRPRKTSKAEIILASNVKTPETAAFKSEVEAKIDAFHPQKLRTQKSEVAFPVAAVIPQSNRSSSLEPEGKMKTAMKERIIPIHVEPGHQSPPQQSSASSLPAKPPMAQRSMSQRSGSLSRQSTMDSDTDSALGSTIGPEPIRKSPREYIIPIAVEGGSYVTPRSDSVEPEIKTGTLASNPNPPKTRFGRPRRMGSLLSDASEDESPFSTLHRDSDDLLQRHMHRLRSSRPTRQTPEHADSLSSGEDDDDDGFELLTAENLFSTLLSRVRSLTQRLNVDDNRGTGFPRSRLLDRLGSNSSQGFWGLHEPLSRRMPESPFRRSLSRDTDRFGRKDSAMSSTPGTPNSLGGRSTTPSRESIFEMGSSNTLPRDKNHRDDTTATDTDSLRLRKESSMDKQLPEQSGINTSSHENYTPSLARRLSRQFIEQTRHSLPRSPSIPRDRLYRSSTEEPTSSLASTLLPERSEYRSRSSDRNLRRTNSLLDAERPDRSEYRSTRRSVSLFADDDDETLTPLPRQVMTLGRKYRDPVKAPTNGIRRDNFCRTEKIQEESHDELNSPRKGHNVTDLTVDHVSTSEGTSVCNSNPNLGDTMSNLSTKSCETSSTESTSNIQGEALSSFKADAKEFESRLLAAENLIKESKLRNLGLNRFDPNLNSSYKDTEKCDKEFLGSMTDLTNSVLGKRRSCIPSLRLRSGSLNREASSSCDRRPSVAGGTDINDVRAPTPERSLLSKLFRSGSSSRDSESKDKSPKARRRISRFLRPDFFDTPREESQYVKDKEAQKAAENERRKARFMKKKIDNKEDNIEMNNAMEEKPQKELKNEANELTRDKNELPKDNKSDKDSASIMIENTDSKLERQNSKNSFLQSLEKKLEKLRSNDAESSKISCENGNEKVIAAVNQENLTILTVEEPVTSEKCETIIKASSIEESPLVNDVPQTTSKSRVSSVLGLFKNESKSAMNGTRNPGNLLSKFKKSAYKGSRSDTSVIIGEPSAGSKIPTKSTKSESKSPRRSLECKKSPEKMSEIKKSPPKEKAKEKTLTEQRLSVERKTSVDRQIKSPKKLSPEKSIDVNKSDRVEKPNIKDRSIEKEIRKSASPEKIDNKMSFTARLMKKPSPDKMTDNKKVEAKNTDVDEKKVLKVKRTVKSLTALTKNGSISKLEKDDDSDKKIKKVEKTEETDKDGSDGTKKKKIVRVVKKVVKKSDSSSDSKSEEKEKTTTKTLLRKITSSTKKENSPGRIEKKKEKSPENIEKKKERSSESIEKKKEKSPESLEKREENSRGSIEKKKEKSPESIEKKKAKSPLNIEKRDEKSPSPKVIEKNDVTITKIDPLMTVDAKISIKEPDNKLRATKSNLKLDLSKIPQHSFKTSVTTRKESPKIIPVDSLKSDTPKRPQETFSKMTHHANITGNKIIIDKPLHAADYAELERCVTDIEPKIDKIKTADVQKSDANIVSKVEPIPEIPSDTKIDRAVPGLQEAPSSLQETSKSNIQTGKIHHQKITPDYTEDILSPMDDGESFDSWSICSNDMSHRGSMDLHSPTSPTYSPSSRSDHHESIIDRIRRKSFYSRFNEKKRKNSLNVPPPGVPLPTNSTLPRKYSFHSSRDTERRKRNYSKSPTRRSSDRLYSLYNDDTPSYRKSSIERDRYSDVGSSLGSFTGELKSPSDHYGSSTSYYDPLSRYRISPVPDSAHRKYSSRDFNLDSDIGPYKSPLSPSASNDGVSNYRTGLSRRYGSVASDLAPKTADYYEELLAPSRIDYLSPRRTPIPGEYPGKHENGYYNGHTELSRSGSDKWRGYSERISGLDSAEDSDRSRGDDIRNNSQIDGGMKELSAACPDTDTNTSIVE